MTARETAIAVCVAAGCLVSAGPRAQTHDPSWTGIEHPEAVIEARQTLMTEMERLIKPIDLYTVDEPADPEDLRSAAISIAQMIRAFPHLFPPTTNLYDEEADEPATLALPAVWDDFATFYSLSTAATAAAETLSTAETKPDLVSGAIGLRAACDACHALFLLPYTPGKVTSEDLEFDFDALFEGIEEDQ